MDELYELDDDDRRLFCRLKCIPATADKLALCRHVMGASTAYLHISAWRRYGIYSSDYHKSLAFEYLAAIDRCLVNVARQHKTSHPRNDPKLSLPLQHPPPPFVFDPPKVSEVQLSLVKADEEGTPVLFGGWRRNNIRREGRGSYNTTIFCVSIGCYYGFCYGSHQAKTPAFNWSNIIQQFEAQRYLLFTIPKDPPLARQWIDERGTGRLPSAPNWMDWASLFGLHLLLVGLPS